MNRNTKRLLEQTIHNHYGLVPPIVAQLLLQVDDGQAIFLEQALSGGTKAERLDGLCRLLFTYGVGTVVEGRLN